MQTLQKIQIKYKLLKNKTRRVLTLLKRKKNRQRIIVSLTSYPARIPFVSQVIRSLFAQKYLADCIILYLSEEQFPNKEKNLPKELISMIGLDFQIHWVKEDMRSHKKYLYAMKEYPNDLIITVDDDILCRNTLIQELVFAYKSHPHSVIAIRAHAITFGNQLNILPYSQWIKEVGLYKPELCNIESVQLFATSGAGMLLPPNSLPEHAFNHEAILKTCLNADDIWLKTMSTIAGFPTLTVPGWQGVNSIEGSQETSLWSTNQFGGNDIAMENIRKYCEEKMHINSFDNLFYDKKVNSTLK